MEDANSSPVNKTTVNDMEDTNSCNAVNNTVVNDTEDASSRKKVNNTVVNDMEDANSSPVNNTTVNDMEDKNSSNAVNNTVVNDMEDANSSPVNNTTVNDMEDANSSSANNTTVNDMEDANSSSVNNTTVNDMEDANSSPVNNTAVNDMEDTNGSNAVNNTAVNDMEDANSSPMNNTTVNVMEDTNSSNAVTNTAVNDMEDANSSPVNNTTVNDVEDTSSNAVNTTTVNDPDDSNDVGVAKDNNDDDDCKIMMLNDDCLKHVFSFLSQRELIKIERVCKWWQSTSLDSWSTIKHVSVGNMLSESRFDSDSSLILKQSFSDTILECILKRCGNYVKSLEIKHNFFDDLKINVCMIAEYCTTLQHLNISCNNIVHSDNSQTLFTHLLILEMELFRARDDDVIGFFNMCPNILSLSILHCQYFNASCLLTLNLEILQTFFIIVNEHPVETFMSSFKRMTSLKLLNLTFRFQFESSQEKFIKILATFPNLEHLIFYSDSYFPDHTTQLTGISKKLVSLNVRRSYLINDLILKEIAASCLKLECLDISGCSYVTAAGISAAVKLPLLKKLCMSHLKCVTDDHLEILACMGKLTKLEICDCENISDIGCIKIIVSCDDLKYLDISECPHITDATVKSAETAVICRTNAKKLKLLVGGTKVSEMKWKNVTPMLILDFFSMNIFCSQEMFALSNSLIQALSTVEDEYYVEENDPCWMGNLFCWI